MPRRPAAPLGSGRRRQDVDLRTFGQRSHDALEEVCDRILASRDEVKNWARAIAMMRHGFGGHAYGP